MQMRRILDHERVMYRCHNGHTKYMDPPFLTDVLGFHPVAQWQKGFAVLDTVRLAVTYGRWKEGQQGFITEVNDEYATVEFESVSDTGGLSLGLGIVPLTKLEHRDPDEN